MCAQDKSGQRYALYSPNIRCAHAPKTKTHRKTRETDMSINYLEQTGIITIETSHTMYGGYTLPNVVGDYPAFQLYFRKVDA